MKSRIIATALITCTFFYFLIFAQFGFLHRLKELDTSYTLTELALFGMGLGGILGCILAAKCFKRTNARPWLFSAFIGCGLTAFGSAMATDSWTAIPFAVVIGASLGVLTVIIVPILDATIPRQRLGLWTGLGAGAAYSISNIPWIFNSSATDHSLAGGIACIAGILLSNLLPNLGPSKTDGTLTSKTPLSLFLKPGFFIVVAIFTVLIWLDSAVFYLIQELPALKLVTWSTHGQLWAIAGCHLIAAILGGWVIDRGWIFPVLIVALLLLIGGTMEIKSGHGHFAYLLFYIVGVSLYSTALIAFAALRPEDEFTWSIKSRAAIVFAIAGWFGSGMGIGMAKDLHQIPGLFLILALVVGGVCVVVKQTLKNPELHPYRFSAHE